MPRLCYIKSTGEVVNDFQGSPVPGTLIDNAVKAGLGVATDFEEKEVAQAEYDKELKKVMDAAAPIIAAQEAVRKTKVTSLKTKLVNSGLTVDELKIMFPHLEKEL